MNQFSFNQFKPKLIGFIAINLLLVANHLKADEVIPLYVEDGNVQVSKVVTRTALGGENVTYVKQLIAPEEKNHQALPVTEMASKTKPSQLPDTSQTITEVKLPDVKPKTGLVVKAGDETVKAEALLHKIKTLKQPEMKVAKYEETLQLAPGEELIKDDKSPSEKKPADEKKKVKKSHVSENTIINRLEFNQANMLDVARALADISSLNFVATEEAAKKNVTVFLQNVSVKDALEAITKNTGLWYRKDKDSGTYRIMTTQEYQRDLVVYREDITRVFDLLHPNPVNVATAVRDLYGDRVILSYGADYDDFSTGEFNSSSGGGVSGRSGSSGGASGGTGLGRGQSGLRRGITSGISSSRNLGSNTGSTQNSAKAETQAGTANNMAITENLSATQLERLEEALQVDENGDLVVKDAIRGISRAQQPIYITISRQQNLMIVRTSDAIAIKEIENLVKAMDKPTQQVLLEMQILEVDVGDAYTQLFSFGALSKNGKSIATSREDTERSGTGKFVYQFIDDLIGIKLELLEQNNQARTVSSPVLLASNNRTARLFVGEERLLVRGATLTDATLNQNGVVVTPARITYETEIRNVGNTLNITPKINADGTVTLGIFQDTSTVNENAVDFPPLVSNGVIVNIALDTINTANIEGVVVAKDGLTVAIGGLIRTSKTKEENKVPVLGDLPLIGNAFKDKFESVSQKEMVLLITPHIMKEPAETDDISRDVVEPLTSQQW